MLQEIASYNSSLPPLNLRGGVKKSSAWFKPKGRVDWRSFRAQPLEIELLCPKYA